MRDEFQVSLTPLSAAWPARAWLRVEGLAVLGAGVLAYAQTDSGWTLFVVLLLAPDLSMLGYLAGERVGATIYNLFHTYTAPLMLAAASMLLDGEKGPAVALIWAAHIGLDRLLGYGLKLGPFHETHLGPIGRQAGRTHRVERR